MSLSWNTIGNIGNGIDDPSNSLIDRNMNDEGKADNADMPSVMAAVDAEDAKDQAAQDNIDKYGLQWNSSTPNQATQAAQSADQNSENELQKLLDFFTKSAPVQDAVNIFKNFNAAPPIDAPLKVNLPPQQTTPIQQPVTPSAPVSNNVSSILGGLGASFDKAAIDVVKSPLQLMNNVLGSILPKTVFDPTQDAPLNYLNNISSQYGNLLNQTDQTNKGTVGNALYSGAKMIGGSIPLAASLMAPIGDMGTLSNVLDNGVGQVSKIAPAVLGDNALAGLVGGSLKGGAELGTIGAVQNGLNTIGQNIPQTNNPYQNIANTAKNTLSQMASGFKQNVVPGMILGALPPLYSSARATLDRQMVLSKLVSPDFIHDDTATNNGTPDNPINNPIEPTQQISKTSTPETQPDPYNVPVEQSVTANPYDSSAKVETPQSPNIFKSTDQTPVQTPVKAPQATNIIKDETVSPIVQATTVKATVPPTQEYKPNDEFLMPDNTAGQITSKNPDGTYQATLYKNDGTEPKITVKANGDNIEQVFNKSTPDQLNMDQRDNENLGSQNIKAYQFNHPEAAPYIQSEANILKNELNTGVKGGFELHTNELGNSVGRNTPRSTTPAVANILDNFGAKGNIKYDDANKALDNIINDNGSENNANSKRIELMIHDRLANGYQDGQDDVPANQEYKDLADKIENKNVASKVDDNSASMSIPVDKSNILKAEKVKTMNSNIEKPDDEGSNLDISPEELRSIQTDAREKSNKTNQYVYGKKLDYSKDNRDTTTSNIFKNHSNLMSNKQDIIDQMIQEKRTNGYLSNRLQHDVTKNVPNKLDRMAATFYNQVGGDNNIIDQRLQGKDGFITAAENKINALTVEGNKPGLLAPEKRVIQKSITEQKELLTKLNKNIPENNANLDKNYKIKGKDTGYTYRQIMEHAKSLDYNTRNWAGEAQKLTKQVGELSQERGTLDQLEENHMSQSWLSPDIKNASNFKLAENKEKALAGKPRVDANTNGGTSHNQHKVYSDYATGIMRGETPRTLDVGEIAQREGNDMAVINAKENFLRQMIKDDVAINNNRQYDGYASIGTSNGMKVQVPTSLANKLEPILDPNYNTVSKIPVYNDILNKWKSANMGFSLIHYKNLALSALGNGDVKTFARLIKQAPGKLQSMNEPKFREDELDGIKHNLDTSMVSANIDTNRNLFESASPLGKKFDKVGNLRVMNKAAAFNKANQKAIFSGMQRFDKVNDYAQKRDAWIKKNPNATIKETDTAKNSISREVNGTYGGLNWESLGLPGPVLRTMRRLMISPDWTYSDIDIALQALKVWGKTNPKANFFKNAINVLKGSPGGNAARKYWLRSILIFGGLQEGLNVLNTGHGTWGNPKGHELDTEVLPNVYLSTLAGALHDAAKLTGDMTLHGATTGASMFAQGKFNPIIRTAVALATGKNYAGQELYDAKGNMSKTLKNFGNLAWDSALPVPFSTQPLTSFLSSNKTTTGQKVAGAGLIGSGLGTYSDAPSKGTNAGNWLSKLAGAFSNNPDQGIITNMQNTKSDELANSKAASADILSAIQNGTDPSSLESKYGLTDKQMATKIKSANKKLTQSQLTPMQQQVNLMSKADLAVYNQQNGTNYSKN